MHARYYGNTIGRFLSVDPTQLSANSTDPQSWNRYAYVNNNPVNRLDLNGQWGTDAHNNIFKKALPGLSPEQLKILYKASKRVDRLRNQGISGSHEHGQKKPWEDTASAKAAIEKELAGKISAAKQLQGTAPNSVDDIKAESLAVFGEAAHTKADQASPAHTDKNGNPTAWYGIPSIPSSDPISTGIQGVAALMHKANEPSEPNDQQLQKAIKDIQDAFKETYGEEALKQAMLEPMAAAVEQKKKY